MNLRFLQTVVAFSQADSLVAAARALGISHAAVSQHIKSLEQELNIEILDRMTRPPRLTDAGMQLVDHAQQMLRLADDLRALAETDEVAGTVRLGVVPSALVHLMPRTLAGLRTDQPKLDIHIRSGLSEQLLLDLTTRDLDMALLTRPELLPDGLTATEIGREPLDVVCAGSVPEQSVESLLTSYPFIWFSRRTWTGQQIERHLKSRKILLRTAIEIDSIEAIEALVAAGTGVSITPRRLHSTGPAPDLRRTPLTHPPMTRDLVLVRPERTSRARAVTAMLRALQQVAGSKP